MESKIFIGRDLELKRLAALHKKNSPSLVVIKGRRRIGKSRLVNFFASQSKKNKLWDFSGLAPEKGMDGQTQRGHFARQLSAHVGSPPFTFHDWSDAFTYLSSQVAPGDIV